MPLIFDKQYSEKVAKAKAEIRDAIAECIEKNVPNASDKDKVLTHVLTMVSIANSMIAETLRALQIAEEMAFDPEFMELMEGLKA